MRSGRVKIVLLCLIAAVFGLCAVDTVEGQRGRGRGYGRGYYLDENLVARNIFPGNVFTFCRIAYSSGGYGGYGGGYGGRYGGRWGGGWRTDYPASDLNFSLRLSELTTIEVNRDGHGEIVHAVVKLTDDELFDYPFIYMLEVGALEFSEAEQDRLRAYLLRGGFLMVDDFWGDAAWDNWEYEIGQVFPPDKYPIKDIPLDHPLFNIVFKLKEVPQVPAVGRYDQWAATGSAYEGQPTTDPSPHCRGIWDVREGKEDRLMMVIMHNTDLGDGWEREGEDERYFHEFSAKRAYPMGINIVVYAMTH